MTFWEGLSGDHFEINRGLFWFETEAQGLFVSAVESGIVLWCFGCFQSYCCSRSSLGHEVIQGDLPSCEWRGGAGVRRCNCGVYFM